MSMATASIHLMNNYSRWPVRLVKGQGNTVWDEAGRSYLDFTSGLGVTSLGHVPPSVAKKLHEQIDTLWHSSNLFEHPLQEQLAAKLCQVSGLDRAFFCNSGAEANEAAIKLARRYAQRVKGEERYEVITFQQSFHGRTLATLTATGQEKVKDGFAPLPDGFKSIPFNDSQALRNAISDRTCAVMLELVQGEGGVHPADPAWVKEVRQLCDEHGILLIIDEVQTGIGRTGDWFAFQQYGIKPDIISVAKALGSGFPVGGILADSHVAEGFAPGSHGTTFGGNPLAMAAGIATLETIEQEQLLVKVKALHQSLFQRLQQIQQAVPDKVKAVRGRGLLLGMEVTLPAADILAAAREQGVLLLQAGPQVVRLLPSFVTTEAEIDQVADLLLSIIRSQ
ncbi:aspartate aminotransferase family protein [Brevibacillus sp. SYP-B805]|uniref:aspartate aminotransferase family protein n=1 Tax=Brevibacillus sp. SYP-B805 TaxID=1578199 RepID=UPI0013EC9830|nr:aspartate aminotransferase family protein [Brevibacillus sp. SYP-B805]NGQ95671.1 aspartate aminotransferase family protein [Brevibacillus sp. SYP-B805]